jgi:hypothetical protein
VSFL